MERRDFVVLGLDDVHGAADAAVRQGWECRVAPAAIARALKVREGCRLLRRPDARLTIVVTPAPVPCRAAGWWRGSEAVALDHVGARFHAVLAMCPTTEAMVAALVTRGVPALAG